MKAKLYKDLEALRKKYKDSPELDQFYIRRSTKK